MRVDSANQDNWRDYQESLRRTARRRYLMSRLPVLGLYAGSAFLLLFIIFYAGSWIFANLKREEREPVKTRVVKKIATRKMVKKDLPPLLKPLDLNLSPATERYSLADRGQKLTIKTSFDIALQNYILNFLKRSLTYQASVVVIRPDNGRILAMADYEKEENGKKENYCLRADYPAASLFKVISAAAAIEARNFTPEKVLVFQGRKHTLYRKQLRRVNKGAYLNKISLRKAFGGSINPVFGKIGIYDLGKGLLTQYSDKFLFNHSIPFDLPLAMSYINIPEDDFGLAEIASGFNKTTCLSPLHAALISAAIANKGKMMSPWLVKEIRDKSGKVLYRRTISSLARPIKEDTAKKLRVLMKETVINGTCRRAFRPLRRKKIFKNIALGAKTGTINDALDQHKVDWLMAYAIPDHGKKGICITVLAIHGEKLGIRAKDIARYIIDHHFKS